MTQSSILSTHGLTKTFTSGRQRTSVFAGLNLEICEGEFTVIMGSSGSGKSTLLYLLSGLAPLTDGEIWLEDQAIHEQSEKQLALLRRKEIGFVFQDPNLVPNLTVRENVLIAGYLGGETRRHIRQKMQDLLEQVGIDDLADRLPSQLSGGQQQRAAIVRALIHSPRILMADEPTGNLNSSASQAVLDVFSSFHQLGQTILMVTHEVKSACRGERILYLRDGNIIDELRFKQEDNPANREAKLIHWLSHKDW